MHSDALFHATGEGMPGEVHAGPWANFPDVELVPVSVANQAVPDFRAIVSRVDGRVLGMHRSRYRLITHEEAFDAVNVSLAASSIDQEGMEVYLRQSHHGARAFCEYRFPAECTHLGEDDDVCLRIILVNSYDQSSALRLTVGAFRFICSNGMIIGERYSGFSHRHTGELALTRFTESLDEGLGIYRQRSTQWKKWRLQKLSPDAAERTLEQFPEMSDLRRETLLEYFHDEMQRLGQTRWAFYNGLTSWATHGEIQRRYRNREAALRMERERLVSRIMARLP